MKPRPDTSCRGQRPIEVTRQRWIFFFCAFVIPEEWLDQNIVVVVVDVRVGVVDDVVF